MDIYKSDVEYVYIIIKLNNIIKYPIKYNV